jgi:hypothetical protein
MIIFELKSGKEAAFNLTKTELIDMDLDHGGNLSEQIREAMEDENTVAMFRFMKEVILRSYGVRYDSDDKMFVKNSLLTGVFKVSRDFDEVLNAILKNENISARFMEGIISEKTLRVRRRKS